MSLRSALAAGTKVALCHLETTSQERWPSGRRHSLAKGAAGKTAREFESLSLRHFFMVLVFKFFGPSRFMVRLRQKNLHRQAVKRKVLLRHEQNRAGTLSNRHCGLG